MAIPPSKPTPQLPFAGGLPEQLAPGSRQRAPRSRPTPLQPEPTTSDTTTALCIRSARRWLVVPFASYLSKVGHEVLVKAGVAVVLGATGLGGIGVAHFGFDLFGLQPRPPAPVNPWSQGMTITPAPRR